jgi:membrane-associated HD superfamily phosphohydrolase
MRFGGLFQNLGLLTAVMMIGLIGGLTVVRAGIRLKTGLIFSCLTAVCLTVLIISEPDSRLIFFLLSLLTGVDQGLLFGLMNRERGLSAYSVGAGKAAVVVYATEMAGAGFASLAVPLVVIPVFGFPFLFILTLGLILFPNILYLAGKPVRTIG